MAEVLEGFDPEGSSIDRRILIEILQRSLDEREDDLDASIIRR